MTTTARFAPGQRVKIVNTHKYSGLGTVEAQLPKNVKVVLDDGRRVRFDPYFLTADLDAPAATAQVELTPYVPAPQPGTVVRCSTRAVARTPQLNGLWIVCGGQGDKSRLFRLNNKDGRYWRVPNVDLIPVNATVTEVGA